MRQDDMNHHTDDYRTQTISEAIVQRIDELRYEHNIPRDQLYRTAEKYGFSRGAQPFRGIYGNNQGIALEDVLAVAQALSELSNTDVSLNSLVAEHATYRTDLKGDSDTPPHPNIAAKKLRSFLSGQPIKAGETIINIPTYIRTRRIPTNSEVRTAERLGVSGGVLHQAAMELWGMSLADKTRQLAGNNATHQKRGVINRDILQPQLYRYFRQNNRKAPARSWRKL